MKAFFLLIALLGSEIIMAQDFLTADIISSVFNLKYGNSSGTTFLIDAGNEQFLVTARHIFPKVKNNEKIEIEIFHEKNWKKEEVVVHLHQNPDIDIAVLKPKTLKYTSTGISLKGANLILGDEGFFLGFPYQYRIIDKNDFNAGFPIPLIKKAVYSGTINERNIIIHYLDGHNNPGFSGGPVVFFDRMRGGEGRWLLMGVVSAYVNQKNKLETPFGDFDYGENSGIIVSYDIRYITEIIGKIQR